MTATSLIPYHEVREVHEGDDILNVESAFRRFNIRLQIRSLRVLRDLSALFCPFAA
jgi:hypothetical protein